VRDILASRDLTLYEVSLRSRSLYGVSSPHFIPHNFYYELRRPTFSPSLYHFAALSRISGYRLSHWLRAFHIPLENISRMQLLLPAKRTILLDSSVVDEDEEVPWFRGKAVTSPRPPIAPLTQLLEFHGRKRIAEFSGKQGHSFRYAKIGREDALVFPEVVPGSIVRVNLEIPPHLLPTPGGAVSKHIFLLEHTKGLTCSRLRNLGQGLLMPVSTKLPYAQIELRQPTEANLVGIVDLEIRPLTKVGRPEVPKELARRWKPTPVGGELRWPQLLKRARTRVNLSLHAASELSRTIAVQLRDDRYFISVSSLSDYEAADSPPRHVHKILTLCGLYGLEFDTILHVAGIPRESLGTDSIADDLLQRGADPGEEQEPTLPSEQGGFLEELLRTLGEVPFFLRNSLDLLTGSSESSLEDFFWVGGNRDGLHPYLEDGLMVALNRRKKNPRHYPAKPLWEQPVYLLMRRDGSYLCACCSVEDDRLILHPYPQQVHLPMQFWNHDEAEVIGQVVAIVRRLP
jgi:hypothetical protein